MAACTIHHIEKTGPGLACHECLDDQDAERAVDRALQDLSNARRAVVEAQERVRAAEEARCRRLALRRPAPP